MLFDGQQITQSFGIDGVAQFFLGVGGLKIDYFLVVKVNGVKQAVVPLPEQPDSVQIVDEFYENPIYTFKQDFAYREIARARRKRITISGQVGTKRRANLKATGLDGVSKMELVNETGEENLKNFELFLNNYHKKAAGEPMPASYSIADLPNDLNYSAGKPYLELKCFKERISGRCAVQSFTYRRDTKGKRLGGYFFQLELLVYDETSLEEPLGFNFLDELSKSIDDMAGKAQLALDVLSGIGETAINSATGLSGGVVSSLGNVMNSAIRVAQLPVRAITAVDEVVADVLQALNTVYDGVAGVIGSFAAIGDYFTSDRLFAGTRAAYRDLDSRDWWINDVGEKAPIIPAPTGNPQLDGVPALQATASALLNGIIIIDALESIERFLGAVGAFRRTQAPASVVSGAGFLQNSAGLDALATLNAEPNRASPPETEYVGNYTRYVMREGENLLLVATRLLGDPNEWTTLARVNRCLDAYTFRDGSPLLSGTAILVPNSNQLMMHNLGGGTTIAETSAFEDEYGVDLYIHPITGDLVLQSESGESILSYGVDNLKQAILIMIRTAIGDITADPRFGTPLSSAIGSKFTEAGAALILTDIEELLLSDPRIVEVSNVQALPRYQSEMLEISMDIRSYLGDTVSVRVPV